jgi:hypothetical protein
MRWPRSAWPTWLACDKFASQLTKRGTKVAKLMKLFSTTLVFVGALSTMVIGKELIVPPIHTTAQSDAAVKSTFQKPEAQVTLPKKLDASTTQQPAPTTAPSKCYGHAANGALTIYAPVNGRCP